MKGTLNVGQGRESVRGNPEGKEGMRLVGRTGGGTKDLARSRDDATKSTNQIPRAAPRRFLVAKMALCMRNSGQIIGFSGLRFAGR